jgi:hypothetical protein
MYKTNRQNHDFQIAYFIAGSMHTADGAYAALCDQRENREQALRSHKANQYRRRLTLARAREMLASIDPLLKLEGEVEIAELESTKEIEDRNFQACLKELAFINRLIEKIQPLRKYAHLPDDEAFEVAQREEWKLELMNRAQNMLVTMGAIPHDHFSTMRMHPDFHTDILPYIELTKKMMASNAPMPLLLTKPSAAVDIPKLLLE